MAKRFVKLNEALGYCFNVEDAYECIAKFQTKSNHDFTIAKADKGFGNIGKCCIFVCSLIKPLAQRLSKFFWVKTLLFLDFAATQEFLTDCQVMVW